MGEFSIESEVKLALVQWYQNFPCPSPPLDFVVASPHRAPSKAISQAIQGFNMAARAFKKTRLKYV